MKNNNISEHGRLMIKTVVLGFDGINVSVINKMKDREIIDVAVWIGKNPESTIHRKKFYRAMIKNREFKGYSKKYRGKRS